MADKDILAEELEAFSDARDAEEENRNRGLESLKFYNGEQWPEKIAKERNSDGRPCLTINKMPAFVRQVVNDGRQNRPQIKVKPVDDNSDPETAEIFTGLIRNIEYESKADIAYDTALMSACTVGWGYLRVLTEYENDFTFDQCIKIKAVPNPFSVYGDPNAVEADGSDWMRAFITEYYSRSEFQRKFKGADEVDWEASGYEGMDAPWREDNQILVAESWKREVVKKKIYMLSDGQVMDAKTYEKNAELFSMLGIMPVNEREADGYKVTQRIMSGAEVLESNDWSGKYIPIVPVYGDEINIEGKRHWYSLIHHSMDAQRMFNYWRTQATELVALAPKVPFIGEEGAFDKDPEKWATANSQSHAYLEYKRGTNPPQRQPLDPGQAIGSMSEAMAANDDMKAILGIYDASLGARSNETSGKAIMARQREGDVSTFHFIDNLSRGIRQLGSVIVDLIPSVYSGERIIRILGEDGQEAVAKVGEKPEQNPMEESPSEEMGEIAKIYDLSAGRYDVAVDTGPSYTTQREETANMFIEILRAQPQAFPMIADKMFKVMNLPDAEELGDRFKAMLPDKAGGGPPPELMQALEKLKQDAMQFKGELDKLKADKSLEQQKITNEAYKAETDRMKELLPYMPPETLAALGLQMNVQAMNTPDIAPGGAPSQEMNHNG
jgi:hypothetical protein